MKLRKNKKGMELSLQTVVVMILLAIAFVVIVYFLFTRYGEGASAINTVGSTAINQASSFE